MKKLLILTLLLTLCLIVFILYFTFRGDTPPTTTTVTTTTAPETSVSVSEIDPEKLFDVGDDFQYIGNEDDGYSLFLPNAPKDVYIFLNEDCIRHLSKIDKDLFLAAGKKIFASATEEYPLMEITIDGENYIYLYAEYIEPIDPPLSTTVNGELVESGCNIDHKHVIFRERITQNPIQP